MEKPKITFEIVKGVEYYLSHGMVPLTFVNRERVKEYIHNCWEESVELRALVMALKLVQDETK